MTKGENKAAVALQALKSVSPDKTKASSDEVQAEPCSNYVLDPTASVFAQCLCGHPKSAHIVKQVNPAEVARASLSSKSGPPTSPTRKNGASEPCSEFRVDTKSDQFATCICGHPQNAHRTQEVNPAEAALLGMKEKNAQKKAAKAAEEAAKLEAERKAKEEEEAREREAAEAKAKAEEEAKAGEVAEAKAREVAEANAKAKVAPPAKGGGGGKEDGCFAQCTTQCIVQ